MIGLLLLACTGPGADGPGSDGDSGGEAGDSAADSGGSESGQGRGGWFTLSATRYEVPAAWSTCAALEASWTLGAVGADADGNIASVGHALGSTPTDGATWAATTNPQPMPEEAYFYLRIGASTIYGADDGELSASLDGDVATIAWTDVQVFGVEDASLTGTSSGALGCVPA